MSYGKQPARDETEYGRAQKRFRAHAQDAEPCAAMDIDDDGDTILEDAKGLAIAKKQDIEFNSLPNEMLELIVMATPEKDHFALAMTNYRMGAVVLAYRQRNRMGKMQSNVVDYLHTDAAAKWAADNGARMRVTSTVLAAMRTGDYNATRRAMEYSYFTDEVMIDFIDAGMFELLYFLVQHKHPLSLQVMLAVIDKFPSIPADRSKSILQWLGANRGPIMLNYLCTGGYLVGLEFHKMLYVCYTVPTPSEVTRHAHMTIAQMYQDVLKLFYSPLRSTRRTNVLWFLDQAKQCANFVAIFALDKFIG